MGLTYMLETLPFTDVLQKVFEGSGECAEKGWEFLHLSIAGWTLVFFVALSLGFVVLTKVVSFFNPPRPGRPRAPVLRRIDRSQRLVRFDGLAVDPERIRLAQLISHLR